MSRDAVPFVEEPAPHKGWSVFRFDCMGASWRLTIIDHPDDQKSLLSRQNASKRDEFDAIWPTYEIFDCACLLNVEAAAAIIRRAFTGHAWGHRQGMAQAKRDIRVALGVHD